MAYLAEATSDEYNIAHGRLPEDRGPYWFAKVHYENNEFEYFKFDKPYDVKVSDLFSSKGNEGILAITIV